MSWDVSQIETSRYRKVHRLVQVEKVQIKTSWNRFKEKGSAKESEIERDEDIFDSIGDKSNRYLESSLECIWQAPSAALTVPCTLGRKQRLPHCNPMRKANRQTQ